MKRILSVLIAAALLFSGFALAENEDLGAAPRTMIDLLYQGEFQQVFDQSTADFQAAIGSAEDFATAWAQIEQVYGAFEEITGVTAQEENGAVTALVTCAHTNADITYNIVLYAENKLAGLAVANVVQKASESTADASLFVSEPIILRAGETDETQGLLTLPTGEGPFPAVIMMQGSGPSDMNETAYGIAIFRDLADLLAQAGVASIRYDKYTYAHGDLLLADPDLLAGFTVAQEYIPDAQAALALLQADARIGEIYLLGHSLGAMMIPRVMQSLGAENITGGVMVAGSPLALWELSYHQSLAYIRQSAESDSEEQTAELDAEIAKLDQMRTMTDDELKDALYFGASAYYQMDQMSFDSTQAAIELQKPLLIVQGGKDWQVTPADGIEAWQAALDGKLTVTYLEYPDMTHMLFDMEGEPAGNASDYQSNSVVSQTLISDVAAWILGE